MSAAGSKQLSRMGLDAKRREPGRPKHSGHLRDRGFRRCKHHCSVVTKHNVECLAPKRQALRVALDQRNALRLRTCVGQLLVGQIETYRPRTNPSQGCCPLSGPTAEFKHVTFFDAPKNAELGFRNSPNAPGHPAVR